MASSNETQQMSSTEPVFSPIMYSPRHNLFRPDVRHGLKSDVRMNNRLTGSFRIQCRMSQGRSRSTTFSVPCRRCAVMLHGDNFGLSMMTSDGWPSSRRLVSALTKPAPDARSKFFKRAGFFDFFMLAMTCGQLTVLNASTCVAGPWGCKSLSVLSR